MNSNPSSGPVRIARGILVVLLIAGLSLAGPGCKNPKGTTWLGTAIGAIVGTTAGALIDNSAESALIGGAVGALAGAGIGFLVYKKQMHLEAQVTASKARVDQAEDVLKQYRRYNEQLAGFATNASNAARELSGSADLAKSKRTPAEVAEAKAGLVTLINDAEKGGRESVQTLKIYREKVETETATATAVADTATSTEADEARRQRQLQRIEELKQEEARLIEQLDALTGIRGQVGGGV